MFFPDVSCCYLQCYEMGQDATFISFQSSARFILLILLTNVINIYYTFKLIILVLNLYFIKIFIYNIPDRRTMFLQSHRETAKCQEF